MDINCSSRCAYQSDGKCNMHELPFISQVASADDGNGCPYFVDMVNPYNLSGNLH